MSDFGEFRRHWRPLLACFLGMGSALSLNSYILSVFAPYLVRDFGWTRSQWAMLGVVQLLMVICLPVAGRLTDVYGVRRVAAVGALSFPVFLLAIANVGGDIRMYTALYIAQTIVCSTATSTVYSRVVAQAFKLKRGLALAICGSSPPLISALGSPLISAYVVSHGWRAGYVVVAIFCGVCAILTLSLLPRHVPPAPDEAVLAEPGKGVYHLITRMPAFWIMLSATLLVNLPFSLAHSQLKLVVLDQGLGDATAALLVSVFAVGSIAGRVISGAALDYLPAHRIAAIGFALPFFGLAILASSLDSAPMVTFAVLLIGVSFGGEADIIPYLVTRYFPLPIYSTVLGLLSAAMGAAMAGGNALLSFVLDATDSFDLYLVVAAAGSFLGSMLFLMLGRSRTAPTPAPIAV
jgi:MFS family permease